MIHYSLKKKSLTMIISCALALGFAPQFYGISHAAEVGKVVNVEADMIQETTADSSGKISNNWGESTYTDVTIQNGGHWRPMDAILIIPEQYFANSGITIDKLNAASGSIIDLSWQETCNPVVWSPSPKYDPANPPTNLRRNITVNNATLADGTTFRIRAEAAIGEFEVGENNTKNCPGATDIRLGNETSLVEGKGTLYVQLGNIINFDPTKINHSSKMFGDQAFLQIFHKENGQFKVEGQETYMDAPLNIYKVTPVIEVKDEDKSNSVYDPVTNGVKEVYYSWLTAHLKDYIVDNTGILSESAKSASDMQLAMRNLWRVENTNAFSHMQDLHTLDSKNTEGTWANIYGGKFTNSSSYGRSVSENYHGMQVGYDKKFKGSFSNGKIYAGLFCQQTKADTGIHTGNGDSKSTGFGIYTTWVGNNGHYADLMLRCSKLKDDYHFYSNGGKVTGEFGAWASGLNAQYGVHKTLNNGWFYEPQVGMAIGTIDKTDYLTSNGLKVVQDRVNVLTGRLGVLVGRSLGKEKGNIYAKAAVNHDFLDGGSLTGSYSEGTQEIETGASKDTWCELALGANTKISPAGNFNLHLLHTFGGDVKNKWQVNGGFAWRWN